MEGLHADACPDMSKPGWPGCWCHAGPRLVSKGVVPWKETRIRAMTVGRIIEISGWVLPKVQVSVTPMSWVRPWSSLWRGLENWDWGPGTGSGIWDLGTTHLQADPYGGVSQYPRPTSYWRPGPWHPYLDQRQCRCQCQCQSQC